jgi:hypothetical protein
VLLVTAGRQRRAMRHAGNHVQLDNICSRRGYPSTISSSAGS